MMMEPRRAVTRTRSELLQCLLTISPPKKLASASWPRESKTQAETTIKAAKNCRILFRDYPRRTHPHGTLQKCTGVLHMRSQTNSLVLFGCAAHHSNRTGPPSPGPRPPSLSLSPCRSYSIRVCDSYFLAHQHSRPR